jgi:hypothetical protein
MPTYTTSAKVLAHLPSSPPASVTDNTAADIADASDRVEAEAGPRFARSYQSDAQKFPNVADTPATPAIIEQAARFYAVSMQYARLGESVTEDEVPMEIKFEARAEKLMQKIRDNEAEVAIAGASLKSPVLEGLDDEIYEAGGNEPVFNTDDMNIHLP